MPKYTDSLRGYAHATLKRDNFKCRYCGLDGQTSFSHWLSLSWDHLLPKEHPDRNKPQYIVAACSFCNVADNWYFRNAAKNNITFEGKTPEELVAQRRSFVMKTREAYKRFWFEHVAVEQPDSASAVLPEDITSGVNHLPSD